MRQLRKISKTIYAPILITVLFIVSTREECHAGHIRSLVLQQTQPGKVYLSPGRSTAISFPSKPEKLVPGAPGRVMIEFVNNNDISVSPVSSGDFGNLIIYTKAGRFVILFEKSNTSNYDDAVNVRFFNQGPSLRLTEDSFYAETVNLFLKSKSKNIKEIYREATGLFTSNDLKISGLDIFSQIKDLKTFRCHGCAVSRRSQDPQIICSAPIKTIECEDSSYSQFKIMRRTK